MPETRKVVTTIHMNLLFFSRFLFSYGEEALGGTLLLIETMKIGSPNERGIWWLGGVEDMNPGRIALA